ncbi:hypothetical protein [Pectinatus brassicae]|uniref:Tfp pilus assembly protein PilN n=1 Tax=Pectinatus brassicae TaxID=862415 RepID=A0A840UU93_9FIRM|nr:hypothetical protein [Pectinatus brassicae]MBB5336513.1 Tfp pilus assembly protein PilN [Pectinatus brassicae]
MIKKFKSFFSNDFNKIVTLTIFNNNFYFTCLHCHNNIWSVRSVSQIPWKNSAVPFSLDWLYQTVLTNHCQNLPVIVCLPESFFLISQNSFPSMTLSELKKSIYWEIRSKNIASGNAYAYSYTYNPNDTDYLIQTYAMLQSDIAVWQKHIKKVPLKLYGIYPQQSISYTLSDNSNINIKFRNISCTIKPQLDNNENIPDYILAATQPLLLKNTELNLLPAKQQLSFLSTKKLILSTIAVTASITCIIFLYYQIKIADLNSAIEKQSLMLSSLQNISLQQNLLNKYKKNIMQRQSILLKLNNHKKSYHAILANLGAVSNESTIITDIITNNGANILISGTANDYSHLQKYLAALKDNYFPDIILLSAEKQSADNIKFILKLPH